MESCHCVPVHRGCSLLYVLSKGMNQPRLYHITTEREARAAAQAGKYTPAAFNREGFIHCSYAHQVVSTINRIFRGRTDLVVLEINPELLDCTVLEENLEGG